MSQTLTGVRLTAARRSSSRSALPPVVPSISPLLISGSPEADTWLGCHGNRIKCPLLSQANTRECLFVNDADEKHKGPDLTWPWVLILTTT